MALQRLEGFRALRDEPLVPRVPAAFASGGNVFDVIRAQDVLVHHPYESFGCVVDFIERAADDPQVLAIKQTLYRTSGGSPIIPALARAAQNGKQVTALVELKARFDEENNIVWARELEQAGVHVVYGVVGLKTHCKAALVVRREPDGIRRYVHLSTGNYNPTTARIYTDLGLFTADPDFGEDVSAMFNLLTGLLAAPRLAQAVRGAGGPARAGHRADRARAAARRSGQSGADHRQDERPGRAVGDRRAVPRVAGGRADRPPDPRHLLPARRASRASRRRSASISIVDRFLEHSRIFYFENAGEPEVFLASADWMPRNFFRRIEVMFPIEDPRLKARIVESILPTLLGRQREGPGPASRRQLRPGGAVARTSRRCAPRSCCRDRRGSPPGTWGIRSTGCSSRSSGRPAAMAATAGGRSSGARYVAPPRGRSGARSLPRTIRPVARGACAVG